MYWKEVLYYLTFPAFIFISWKIVLFVLKNFEKRREERPESTESNLV